MNTQAADVARSATGDAIEVATRCELVTEDQTLAAAGVGGINRGLMKGMKGMSKVMMPRMGADMDNMRTGGLPKSFVLAVGTTKVYAIEDKHDGGSLVAGKIIKEWDRDGFTAKAPTNAGIASISGVPEDRQMLIIYLPIEGAKTKYMKAAAGHVAAAGSAGMPTKVMVAKDETSRKVLDAIVTTAGPGNIMIGGQSLEAMMAQAAGQVAPAAAADPAEQLSKLADLRDRGVLSDDEFAQQKAKLLGA
jgi:hypothetical protein